MMPQTQHQATMARISASRGKMDREIGYLRASTHLMRWVNDQPPGEIDKAQLISKIAAMMNFSGTYCETE